MTSVGLLCRQYLGVNPRNHVASKFVELSMITADGRIRT